MLKACIQLFFVTNLKDLWFTVVLGLFLLLILKKHCTHLGKLLWYGTKKTLLTATDIHLTSQLFTLDSLPKGGGSSFTIVICILRYINNMGWWIVPLHICAHGHFNRASSWAKNTAVCALGHGRKCGVTECIG